MNTFRGEEGALWASLLPVPASSRVAREVLFCPRSANKEQRVEGWAASQGWVGCNPVGRGKVREPPG